MPLLIKVFTLRDEFKEIQYNKTNSYTLSFVGRGRQVTLIAGDKLVVYCTSTVTSY